MSFMNNCQAVRGLGSAVVQPQLLEHPILHSFLVPQFVLRLDFIRPGVEEDGLSSGEKANVSPLEVPRFVTFGILFDRNLHCIDVGLPLVAGQIGRI